MKTIKVLMMATVVMAMISCGNDEKPATEVKQENPREKFLEQIKNYEAQMHQSMTLDPNIASLAVQAYSEFVKLYPTDSLAPDYLFKAAEISTANQQYPQALMYYQSITEKYPNYKLKAESLYLQGYLLDNFLNDDAKAKTIYEQVIAKYPDLPYAADAKAAINNLGKSDEELIKEFKKKNAGK